MVVVTGPGPATATRNLTRHYPTLRCSTRSPGLVPRTEERIECCVVVAGRQQGRPWAPPHRRRVPARGAGRDQRGRRRARTYISEPDPVRAPCYPRLIQWDSGTRERETAAWPRRAAYPRPRIQRARPPGGSGPGPGPSLAAAGRQLHVPCGEGAQVSHSIKRR